MIELSIDQITRVVSDFRRKPIVEIRRKWPEVMPAKVRFSENGLVAPLAAGAVVTWVLRRKTDGLVLSTPVAATLVGEGAASYYETLFYFSTDALNPLFANTELRRLECVIEIRWEQTGAGTDQRSITIPAIVERAENPGDLINAQNVTGYPSAQVILDHISDDENPHAVTAAQVGAPPNTRTITAAGLATGGGDLSADRTITVSESGDTATLDETESTTVTTPRKWWQRLNFWIADTAAKTLGGNLTINGVDARLPNGGATFPTPESICTQARGDGRYSGILKMGTMWRAPDRSAQWNNVTNTGSGNVDSISAFGFQLRGTGAAGTSFARHGTTELAGGWIRQTSRNVINWNVPICLGVQVANEGGSTNAFLKIQWGFSGYSTSATAALAAKGIALVIDDTIAKVQIHDGTTLTESLALVTLNSGTTRKFLIVSNGSGDVDVYVNGDLVASMAGGPIGNGSSGFTSIGVAAHNKETTSQYQFAVGNFISFEP